MQKGDEGFSSGESDRFFYITLKSGDQEKITKMFNSLQREGRALLDSIISLIYFMRGALSYTEAMNMSFAERQVVSEFIEKRLEQEKKSPSPVY